MNSILSQKATYNMRRIVRFLLVGMAMVCLIGILLTTTAYALEQRQVEHTVVLLEVPTPTITPPVTAEAPQCGDDPAYVDQAHIDPTNVDPAYVDQSHIDPIYIDPAYVDQSYIDSTYIDPAYIIVDLEIPLATPFAISWSLMNLILTLGGVVLAFMMCIKSLILTTREKEDAKYYEATYSENKKMIKSGNMAFILAIPFLGIAGILLFLLTQDMRFSMVLFDWWTVSHAVIFACSLFSYILAHKKGDDKSHDSKQSFLNTRVA